LARAKQVGRKFENAEAVCVTFAADDAAAAVVSRTVSPAAASPCPSASPLDGAAGQPPAAKRSRTGGTMPGGGGAEPLLAPQFTVDNLREGDQAQWERLYRGYIAFYERHEEQAFYDRHFLSFLAAQKHVRDGFVFNPGPWSLVARDATDSSILLGLVHFVKHRSMKGEVCYMQDLFTEPTARGQGVATQLIHAVVEWSRAQGISKVYWNTHSSNPAREKLYDVVGQHKGYVKYQIDV
jgi:GNAT superfamily N-acetyltransferase